MYMPGITTPPSTHDNNVDNNGNNNNIKDVPLILPSALEPVERITVCQHLVVDHEGQFHLAQLEESLANLRCVHRI